MVQNAIKKLKGEGFIETAYMPYGIGLQITQNKIGEVKILEKLFKE